MSLGVGITFARYSLGYRFGRDVIDRDPEPFVRPLHCDGCRVPFAPVRTPTTVPTAS